MKKNKFRPDKSFTCMLGVLKLRFYKIMEHDNGFLKALKDRADTDLFKSESTAHWFICWPTPYLFFFSISFLELVGTYLPVQISFEVSISTVKL